MSDGLNEYRSARISEILIDFRDLQLCIAAAPTDPPNMDDYYTEGWAALRQCAIDGQHILDVAADVTVPQAPGGPEEQSKAELTQVYLDVYSRRHEAQKIYLRQQAAQRWIEWRDNILMGGRPNSGNHSQLRGCDRQLRQELETITEEAIYYEIQTSDISLGRWTDEDPSLRSILRWIRVRRR